MAKLSEQTVFKVLKTINPSLTLTGNFYPCRIHRPGRSFVGFQYYLPVGWIIVPWTSVWYLEVK